ncbi:MAG: AEC family transporter, partial [Rhodovibrionaceae bacterium]
DPGLTFAIVIFMVTAIGNFTIGASLARGSARLSELARMPVLYAVPAGLALVIWDLHLPQWLGNTVELLGGLTIPLMLLALGVSLSRLTMASFTRSFGLSFVRLAGGFAVGVLVAWIFGLEGVARGVVILQATMPTAVFNYLFAERYGRAPSEVAGMVLSSTLLSFATLPLLLWYLL